MTIYTPYTYLIGWSKLNKWYYGARWRKGCHPNELWVKYFTSSKVVKAMRKVHGEPDIIQVRKTFALPDEAIQWEQNILQKMKVVTSEKWLNRNDKSHKMYIKYKDCDLSGMVTITNPTTGKSFKITTLEYNAGLIPEGYQQQFANTPVMMDDKGVKRRINTNDPTFSTLVGHTAGYTHAVNVISGEAEYVKTSDPRFKTGEISGNQKGKKYYNDGHKNFMLGNNDPKILSLRRGILPEEVEKRKQRRWFNDGVNSYFIKKEDALQSYTIGRLMNNKNKVRCEILGVVYESITQAAKHYNILVSQVIRRIDGKNHPEWKKL